MNPATAAGVSELGVSSGPAGWRHQPPVFAPISPGALAHALASSVAPGADPLEELRSLLVRDYHAAGALLTDSGTHALQLALRAGLAGAAAAERIAALPAFTCFDVATAAAGADARVTLYDVDPGTLAPDPTSLERALELGARVVVVSPLFGVPVDWDTVEAIARPYEALVIEDAAQGHGATWRGRPLGAHGRLSVLSFGRGKGWTGGGGGAVLWRSTATAPAPDLDSMGTLALGRVVVATAAQWALGRPGLYHLPASLPWLGLGETLYREPSPERSSGRLTASLVLATRDAALAEAAARRARAATILEALGHDPFTVRPHPDGTAGYLRLPLRIPRNADLLARRLRRLGVAASYPATLGELPAVRDRRVPGAATPTPGASELVRQVITLPTHSLVRKGEVDRLVAAVRAAAG